MADSIITSFASSTNKEDVGKYEIVPEQGIKFDAENLLRESFPLGFGLGVGGSAVQIEGGWNADGKGPSVWDTLCLEKPDAIDDQSTSFETCDAYGQWETDVQLLKGLGCNTYKLSLSWSRILPNGDLSIINEKGIEYYNNLFDALLANGIKPLVILYHFDLPTGIARKYSWKDVELIGHFVKYAQYCFEQFGDRIKDWITINEPWAVAMASYDLGMFPPNFKEPECVYNVLHNMIVAHAKIYRLYEEKFKSTQNGKIGISLDCFGLEPATDSVEDAEATQIAFEFRFGLLASPLLQGKYPNIVREIVDKKSIQEGRKVSRLPIITPKLSQLIKGTLDFIGFDIYTCEKVSARPEGIPSGINRITWSSSNEIGFYNDSGTYHYYDPSWPSSGTWWNKVNPTALRTILNRIKTTYNNPEVVIAENGFPDKVERLVDNDRANYIAGYLNEALKAVLLDGCNLTGYYYWGFLDGWEWTSGYDAAFGVFHVDRSHPSKTRTPKFSAKILESIYKNNGFKNWRMSDSS